ncbi:DotU family type IV/VI secretion system protein [Myxococcota bacterium]|nr:DotU family type IV/VI secretion system protein [Myxococcota bacterium]
MTDAELDLTLWSAITSAVDEIDGFIEAALGAGGGAPDLDALFRKIVFRLDALREALERTLTASKARQVLAPITFLLDERVLGRLAGGSLDDELDWPLLQRGVVDLEYGGDLFYMQAERLAHGPDPCPLLVQVFDYCLREGFQGRYADRPDVITALQSALWARMAPPLPAGRGAAVVVDRVARPPDSWLVVGLSAAGALLAWQGALLLACMGL